MPAPIFTVAQMREWEQSTWAARITEDSVIQRVGGIVARQAQRMTQPGDLLVLLAGKGHNGDDVRRSLPHYAGRPVKLLNVTDPATGLSDLRTLLATQAPALIVDGLFGIGLNRPLAGAWHELIEFINASGVRILSVDVPSGLDADRGEPQGTAIRATVTVTLGAAKTGLVLRKAAPWVGRLEVVADIGLVPHSASGDSQWVLPEDFAGLPPVRPADGHKGTFGHVVVFAGSSGYHGAAVLAARGALRAHPGLVTVVTLPEVYGPVASQLQAAMVHAWQKNWMLPPSCTGIVLGPGLAAAEISAGFKAAVLRLWHEAQVPMVVDASALGWLPAGPVNQGVIRVITPHPGEAAGMLRSNTQAVEADRPAAVRMLSQQFGRSVVVLKGRHSIIGEASGELHFNSSGNPGLAQGGAGDLLAGYLGGLLAQPAWQRDFRRTVRYGVWAHGLAADRLEVSRPNWTIEELAQELGG